MRNLGRCLRHLLLQHFARSKVLGSEKPRAQGQGFENGSETINVVVSHSRFEKTVLRGILVKVGETNKVTVTLRTGGRIHGSVRSGGTPLAGALVRASRLEGELFQRAASNDVQGQFEIRGLSSGEYTVSGNLAAPERRNTGTRNPARPTQESFSESRAGRIFPIH